MVTKKTKNEGDGNENAGVFFAVSFVPFVSFCSNLLIVWAHGLFRCSNLFG